MTFIPDQGGPLWIYSEPEKGQEYVLGADTAEGKVRDRAAGPIMETAGRDPDFNAVSVLRVSDGVEVATYLSNYATPLFAQDVLAIAHYYGRDAGLPDPLIVPEINGPGLAVVEELRRVYTHLWKQQVFLAVDRVFVEQIGWRTDLKSRPLMLMGLQRAIIDGTAGIRCIRTAQHAQAMRFQNDGQARASGSQKDDLAIAHMLARQGRAYLLQDGSERLLPGQKEPVRPPPKDAWQGFAEAEIERSAKERMEILPPGW